MRISILLAGALLFTTTTQTFAACDPERGRALFTGCTTCHGPEGQGMKEMNAPKLAGREGWYIARQIENFRSGARGKAPGDMFGAQMAPMALTLADAQAIEDVAAYIESLGK